MPRMAGHVSPPISIQFPHALAERKEFCADQIPVKISACYHETVQGRRAGRARRLRSQFALMAVLDRRIRQTRKIKITSDRILHTTASLGIGRFGRADSGAFPPARAHVNAVNFSTRFRKAARSAKARFRELEPRPRADQSSDIREGT